MMIFHSGLKDLRKIESLPLIFSSDSQLDELLLGGFHQELLYLLYGDKKILTDILIQTAVQSFIGEVYDSLIFL